MYTTKELTKIRKSLPKGGYQLIADKVPGLTANSVRVILTEPARSNRPEVFSAVIQVMEEYKEQKKKVMEVVK